MVKIYKIYYLGSIQICNTVLLTTVAKEGCFFHPVTEITLMDSEVDCFWVSLLQQTEEKISEFEDTSVETSKSEMQRGKTMNWKWRGGVVVGKGEYPKLWDNETIITYA